MERLSRIVPMFVSLFLFVVLAIGIHEQGHYIMAKALGVPGYVTFSTLGGWFWYQDPATGLAVAFTQRQDLLIGLAGGFFAALVFGLLWLVNWWQAWSEPGALDESFIFGAMVISQVIYGIGEGIESWVPSAPYWSQGVSVLFAALVVLALYGKRLLAWWEGVRAPTQSQVDLSIPATNIQEEN